MSILVAINHTTEYRFDRPVTLAPHIVRLRPAPHCRTPIQSYTLAITPQQHFINWQQDPFGNYLARLVFTERACALTITTDVIANMVTINPFDFFVDEYAYTFPFQYDAQLRAELTPYLIVREQSTRLTRWLTGVNLTPRETVYFLVDLNKKLHADIGYVIRMEPGVQSCDDTLQRGTGSCRDSAWLLVQILRHLGLAARFVSGYLIQLTADQPSLDGPSGPTHDFTDLHAWAEVYIPGAGWIGLDPTSGLFAGEGHIPLACTPDPISAAPITGATDECEVTFYFHNHVRRIHEDPRVTKPYTTEQWQSIDALGQIIDRELFAQDVRLTMGGEPTFVSIDEMDGAEWNTAALGPTKKQLAENLLLRLHTQFAPGGVLQYGQGKWYPGEPLPRWALTCYWRTDGEPVWRDPCLLDRECTPHTITIADAARFLRTLVAELNLPAAVGQPAYEDVLYYLWREARLPINVSPEDNQFTNPLERARLARLLQQELGAITGYVLPLRWQENNTAGHWVSGTWVMRGEHIFLLPGDSPMGLRLPLDALPFITPEQRQTDMPRDPFAPVSSLPSAAQLRVTTQLNPPDVHSHAQAIYSQSIPASDDPMHTIRTALCLEPRGGHLYCFLPPLVQLEAWLVLVAAIEMTAAHTGIAIILEGYPPPRDARLQQLAVTPDPGVIEVNIHPAHSWSQLVSITTTLYEQARLSRLGTEKFMLDGRHTGTGGGNHVTLGGPAPIDSPFLRRPDLLPSLILYWQHHPSLSYLFSGTFIGPTSQAPRVDEARDDRLYDLEIALQQLATNTAQPPWFIDRMLRNLLTDVTGNTHRTEFCIDKLYSPDSSQGRQGLIEFRAFEMPPHAQMSLAQMLLLRALIARFWQQPYQHKPVRWGTALHDRFLLPHGVWTDFSDVICDLRRAGYPFELDWFAPFFEFRFPHYGDLITANGIQLELRGAIEPWHVLGEEVTAQGTARFVDSAVERLQIKVTGMTPARHVISCNKRRVPLQPTGRRGEYFAGIRFKAWQPPSGLHPTIPAHNPLIIEIIDSWNRASLGGCTYYVAHPGGRSHETFPVNSYEAEGRRIARFHLMGHTPGDILLPPDESSGDYPCTLDLRYQLGC